MSASATILIVDDERLVRAACSRILSKDYQVIEVGDSLKAIEAIEEHSPDLIFLDLQMPRKDGWTLLEEIRKDYSDIDVVILTGHGSIESAVKAIRAGAFDYIAKPIAAEELRICAARALDQHRLRLENEQLRSQLKRSYDFDNMIGQSPAMQKIFNTITKVADTDSSVFISGESGTGKELIARSLHNQSHRKDQQFVPVDCASLPQNLMESELFGHEKGAFTGATSRSRGLLEFADGGTVFLDEITELNLDLQAKLLRALQERQFRRIGGHELIDVDIRVLAATNIEPRLAVENGTFREDLFYRLNVIPLEVPPLRERIEDLPLLVRFSLDKLNSTQPDRLKDITADTIACLHRYHWPGNIRELENLLEQMFTLCDGDLITTADLPDYVRYPKSTSTVDAIDFNKSFKTAKRDWVAKFEQVYLDHILAQHQGNISAAAKASGIDRKTIHRLLSKLDDRTN